MSEEEKKAIENLKKELNQYEYTKDLDLASDNYFGQFEEKINIVTIILNLIEKQQKEIENLKELMAHKNGYTKQLEEDLFENASNYVVNKDKIREKIKEYKGLKEIDKMAYEEQIKPLQELLEEE